MAMLDLVLGVILPSLGFLPPSFSKAMKATVVLVLFMLTPLDLEIQDQSATQSHPVHHILNPLLA